jgi:hypothetical protein
MVPLFSATFPFVEHFPAIALGSNISAVWEAFYTFIADTILEDEEG